MIQRSRLTRPAPRPLDRDVRVPYGVRLVSDWTWRLLVIAVGIVCVGFLAAQVSVVSVAVVIALLLTALLAPLQRAFRRTGMPSLLAAGLTIVTAVAAVVAMFTLVGQRIASSFADLRDQAISGFEQVQTWLVTGPLGLDEAQVNGYVEQARQQLSANSDAIVSGALSATVTLSNVVTGLFLALFATLFFLGDGRRIWAWLVGLAPRDVRERIDGAGRRAWVTLTAYIRATILVATVDAVGIGLGAVILLGPSLAVPIAVLVFLTAFVPIIGAIFSGAVAVLVALVTEGFVVALIMLAVVVGVQQLESNVLQPVLLGRAVALHPLAVALAVTTGILAGGIVGGLFAVPLLAVVNTVGLYLSGREEPEQERLDELPDHGGPLPPPTVTPDGTDADSDADSDSGADADADSGADAGADVEAEGATVRDQRLGG